MKKAVIILTILISVNLAGAAPLHRTAKPLQQYVYICISKTTHKYHVDRNCSGLAHCNHPIKKVTFTQARKMGYTPCKICS